MSSNKSGIFGAIASLFASYLKNSPRIIAFTLLSILPILPFFIPAAVGMVLTETASSYYLKTHSTLITILGLSTLLFIPAFLLSRPLQLGRIYCNLMVFSTKKPRVTDCFCRVKYLKKSITLQFLLLKKAVVCFLPFIVFLIAAIVLNNIDLPYSVYNLLHGKSEAAQYLQLAVTALGVTLYVIGLKSYSPCILAKPVMAVKPELSPKDCIAASKATLSGNNGYAGHMFTCGFISALALVFVSLIILIPLGQIVGEGNINTLMMTWGAVFYFVVYSMLCHYNAMYCIKYMAANTDAPQQ